MKITSILGFYIPHNVCPIQEGVLLSYSADIPESENSNNIGTEGNLGFCRINIYIDVLVYLSKQIGLTTTTKTKYI